MLFSPYYRQKYLLPLLKGTDVHFRAVLSTSWLQYNLYKDIPKDVSFF